MTRSASSLRPVSMMMGTSESLAQAPGDLHSVLAGKLQVENHQVDRFARHHLGDFTTAGERRDLDFVVAEIVGDHLAYRGIVVDGEHVRDRRRRLGRWACAHGYRLSIQHRHKVPP